MSWSIAFRERLAAGDVQPFYLLESVAVPSGAADAFGGFLRLSSFAVPGYEPIIAMPGSTVSFGELRIRTWNASQMSWSIGIMGDAAAVRAETRRGQVVILRVGFSRDLAEFETVAVGTVYNVERKGGAWSIVVRDLGGALIGRISDDPDKGRLFNDLASTLIAAATYTPGDGSLHVGDISGFRTDGGSQGAIRITPDSGDDFILTYTGTTPGPGAGLPRFDGLSATGQFGTTAAVASGGKAVAEVAYIKGQPIEIARKILLSTGTGTNGADDVLPESWGYGIPESLVAVSDMTSYVQEVQPAAGSDLQEFIATEPATNGKQLLDGFLNPAGYFLSQHQGQITCRAALRPDHNRSPAHIVITDTDVASIEHYQAFDQASPVEYILSTVIDAEETALELSSPFVESLPVQNEILHTLPGLYSNNVNHTAIVAEHSERLARWDHKTPERMVLRLIGWKAARVSLGDTVEFHTDVMTDREGRAYTGRNGLIIQAGASWFGSSSRLVVLFLPTFIVAQPLP